MGPESVMVFIVPRAQPTARANAMGRSMCNVRVRSAAHAPAKNTRPGPKMAGVVRTRLTQRKNRSYGPSMPPSLPL